MIEEDEITETVEKKRGCILLLGLPTALIFFSHIMSDAVLVDLIVYRTCIASLNINATDCMMLRTNSGTPKAMDLEVKVEPYASMMIMTQNLLENIMPRVLCLFLGPWSDRGGRRFLFLTTYISFAVKFATISIMCSWNISPWYLILALIPSNMMGGMSSARLALSCYITDMIPEKYRTVQFTSVEALTQTGGLIATLIGPLIYKSYGYGAVFITAAMCCTLALAFAYFRIPESVKNTSKKSMIRICNISSEKEVSSNCSVKERSFKRYLICLAIVNLTLLQLIFRGRETTEFLFIRARLGWNVQQYSYLYSASTMLRIIGLFLISQRGRISEIPDTFLVGIGLMSGLCGALIKSLTRLSWHIYLSLCTEITTELAPPIMRSVASKFIPSKDIGKLFSFTAILEVPIILGGTPLYALIYSHYLPPFYPSPVHLVTASFYAIMILCIICIEILIRKSRKLTVYIAAAQEDL